MFNWLKRFMLWREIDEVNIEPPRYVFKHEPEHHEEKDKTSKVTVNNQEITIIGDDFGHHHMVQVLMMAKHAFRQTWVIQNTPKVDYNFMNLHMDEKWKKQ